MVRKSTLLKTATALALSFLVTISWSADLSDEQEGASKFYCVKLTRNVNYNAAIQLSQQNASYEPDSGESCFEKWDSPEGYQTAYEFIGELLYNSNVQPEALLLASDIDFGGYDGQTRSCNEYFKPFEFDITSQIRLTSAEDGIYTIRGICYTSLSDEASFGGNLIGSIQNVRFENIRLESLTFASLFGTAVNDPEVNNVYVANAAISAPVAGLFVASTDGLYVTDFEGSSIQVRSVPDMDLNDAVDLIYPSSVAIGGLAGSVSNMSAVGVSVDGLSVSNNAYLWDGAHHFVEEVAMVEAHIGGIVGHTGRVELRRVGLDRSLLSDDASAGNKQMSYLGGLVGSLTYNTMVWFHSTYTFSDITCSLERGPQHCKAGYLAGLAVFSDSLSKNANDISIVSNFHYTEAAYDSASGMFGEAYCDYLKPYMPDNEQGLEHISCAYEFNTFGELSVLDDENGETTFAPKAYAHGNYRSAAGNAVATDNFNSDTYMLGGDTREAVSVGIIEKEYMQGQAFADVLNRFNADYGNTSVEWIADTSRVYPYVASTYHGVNAEISNVHRIVFMLDCIMSGCLTESEERMLGQFNNYRMGTNEFEFETDESGKITNTAWLEFAANLEQPNADRDPVHWEGPSDNGPYKRFSADEAYDGDYFFKLMAGASPDSNGVDEGEVDVASSTLFLSGNAVQLAVKTDGFTIGNGTPFVSVFLEDLDGNVIDDSTMDFPNGGWPEMITWEKYPLAAGMYHVVAKMYNGKGGNPDVREWDFEVNREIANDCGDCWQMIALSDVDFDSYKWNDDGVFYWWDEFASFGDYWQYKNFTKKDSPEQGKGYWYNSLEGRPLVLKDEAFTGEAVWSLDSVNSGWNLVSNPYGWKMKIGVAGQENREEKPELEFWRWNTQTGQYDPPEAVEELEPYEAVWVRLNRGVAKDLPLSTEPAFVDFVNEEGETEPVKSLNKKGVLAKAAGADGWALQVELSDANGKMDSWNMLGAGKVAWSSEEPPAGMGNRVNLSIMDAGRRLAKSVKALGEDAYEWDVELSATSARAGYLKFAGIDGILPSGLRVFVTVDGVTTEMRDGETLQLALSTTAKSANIRVAKSARKVVAQTLQGLRASQNAGALQVVFDASAGLDGARSRVDVVDTKGSVVATVDFKAVEGSNRVSLEIPRRGLHVVRVVSGSQVALQKVLLK